MNTIKIGFIIPATSNGRSWNTPNETYLFNTFKSFINSITLNETQYIYKFYIGIDRNDKILDTDEFKLEFNNLVLPYETEFLYMDGIHKGHLTIMWNRLFDKALYDGCNYFYQCGDDIAFVTKGWIDDCINQLVLHNGIGMTGPINNNPRILTQSFVSRKHHELFGYYFPEEIENWYCDDWINDVYKGINHLFPLQQHRCNNIGGKERYNIKHSNYNQYVERDLFRIKNKIQ